MIPQIPTKAELRRTAPRRGRVLEYLGSGMAPPQPPPEKPPRATAELTDHLGHPPPPPEKPPRSDFRPRSPASMKRRSEATANRRSAAAATRAAAPPNPEAMTQDEIIALRMSGGDYLDYRLRGLPLKERQAGITASEDSLYEAAMGMGNPMVALGSDPMRTFFGPFSVAGAVGVYRPKTDMAYAAYNAAVGGADAMEETNDTYRHESIHRTLNILSAKYPELDKYRATDSRGGFQSGFGADLEERIVSQVLGHTELSDAAKMPNAKEFQELMETLDKLARKELMPQSPASVERPSAAERSEAERAETARRFGLGGLLWDTLTQSKTDNDSALPPTETHRNGDDRYVRIGREKVHARGREVVVHPEVLEADPAIWQAISEAMEAMGADPSQAIIGSPTGNYGADGNQEFFVHKRVGKFFKKNPWAGMLATAATAMIPGVGPWLAPIVAGGTTALSGGGVFESLGAAAGSAAGSYFGSTSSGLGGVTAGGQEGTVFNTLAESAAGDGFFSGVSQFAGDALHGSLGAAIGSANVGALVGGGLGASFGASLGALADGPGAAPQGAPLNFNTNETITGPVSLPGDPIGLNNAGLGTGPVEDTTPDLPINQQPNLIEDAPQAFSPYGVKYLQRRKDRNTGRAVFNVVSGPNNQYNRLVRRGFGMGVNFV